MTATIISNQFPYSWGQATNQAIGKLISLQQQMGRLNEAVVTASANWEGTPGTQFEIGNATETSSNQNLFGVQCDPTNPGSKGQDYRYAVNQLWDAWQAFWTTALPYIEQLDNGIQTM